MKVEAGEGYRLLEVGEAVKEGDEFWTFGHGPWMIVNKDWVGVVIDSCHASHRRKIKPVQSNTKTAPEFEGWEFVKWAEADSSEIKLHPLTLGQIPSEETLGGLHLSIQNIYIAARGPLYRRKIKTCPTCGQKVKE